MENNCSFALDVFPVAFKASKIKRLEKIEENDQIIPLSLQIFVFNLKKKSDCMMYQYMFK